MRKARQSSGLLLVCVFALLVLVLDAAFVIGGDRDYSPTENRALQQRPPLTAQGLISGRFERRFEDYVADQFPLRDGWIRVKSTLDRLMGRVEAGGVYLGGDGYLIRDFVPPDEASFAETLAALRAFSARHGDLGQYMLIAPSAVTVLRDQLPPYAPAGDEGAFIDRLADGLSGTNLAVIDPRAALTALSARGQAYYRTDHHWTTDGAWAAYLELARTAGLSGERTPYERVLLTEGFSGTLTASSGFRMDETDAIWAYLPLEAIDYVVSYESEGRRSASVYRAENLEARDKYTVFLDGNHPLIRIETDADSERRALVVKDSYANCLIPFLIPDFQNLTIVDPRYYTEDLETQIEADEITDLIFVYNAATLAADTALRADID